MVAGGHRSLRLAQAAQPRIGACVINLAITAGTTGKAAGHGWHHYQ